MKILLTGSSGYLGSAAVETLKKNHEVLPYDISDGKNILNERQLKESMKGVDIVVHLAAIRGPVEGKTFPEYFELNCIGTFNVVKVAVESGVKKLVYSSSLTYYGVERGIPVKTPITEESQVISQYIKAEQMEPRDIDMAYSKSKVIAENTLAFYGLTKKIEVIILRFSAIGKKFLDTSVSLENAVQGIGKAVETDKKFWFEAFNIVDDIEKVSNEKAKKLLGYAPKPASYE